jgi:hypothetical protein
MSSRLLRRGLAAAVLVAVVATTSCRPPAAQWTNLAMPRPVEGTVAITDVTARPPACAPSGFCLFTGSTLTEDVVDTYASSWQSGRWTALPPGPNPTSVSCASATTCAVGSWSGVSVFDGTRWVGTREHLLFPGVATMFAVVSCGAEDRCVALGGGRAASWNGTAWTPSPDRVEGATAVSCVGPTFCLAAGDPSGKAYRWDGTSWTETPPLPMPGPGTVVRAIACWAVDACLIAAFVEQPEDGPPPPVILPPAASVSWDGSQFHRVQDMPLGVSSLSCLGPDRCVATTSDETARILDGTAWRIAELPPAGKTYPRLAGVSCAQNFCVVSGAASPVGPGEDAWALRWTFPRR